MITAVTAVVFPTLCGWLCCAAGAGQRITVHRSLSLIAPACLLGWALAALGMAIFGKAGQPNPEVFTAVLLFAGAACSALLLWRRNVAVGAILPEVGSGSAATRIVWWLLLLLILLGLVLTLGELQQRPLYPWDAWSAWAVKTRVWFEVGQGVVFVDTDQWLQAETGSVYTNDAWHYPDTIPLIQLWVLRWLGQWDENLMNLAWWTLVVSCLLSTYGVSRTLGAKPLAAMVLCYLLASLPLLNTHVALAGYADLWVACALWAFGLSVVSWSDSGRRFWLVLAFVQLLFVSVLKLEGVLWAAVGALSLSAALMSERARRLGGLVLLAAVIVALMVGGVAFELPGVGRIAVLPDEITMPYLGSFPLSFSNQLPAFVEGLLTDPNWHLTWYLLLPLMAVMLWHFRGQRLAILTTVFTLLVLTLFVLLFFFTGAAAWAENMTASNRLIMQITPLLLILIGTMLCRYVDPMPSSVSR